MVLRQTVAEGIGRQIILSDAIGGDRAWEHLRGGGGGSTNLLQEKVNGVLGNVKPLFYAMQQSIQISYIWIT